MFPYKSRCLLSSIGKAASNKPALYRIGRLYSTNSTTTATSTPKPTTNSQKKNEPEKEQEDTEYTIDVSNLSNRWVNLPSDAQQDIISYLNVKQQFGWNYLTPDEKKALYYISYGNWGARDGQAMNLPEMIFKIMSSSILFGVVGFSLINYAIDKEKVSELEKENPQQQPESTTPTSGN
ncbi:unnamed protein product [Ambrosiozyma monospora]|uniref:Unnamed protein product n=1 Tax=Ambrosiozyma monospora TaxID=43982 RepID=A0ACB5SS78_AMBMO|nr:unnamed protein product [Ambrosiozyma monospora]